MQTVEAQPGKNNLNSLISNNKIEFVVKNLSAKKSTGPEDFTGEFYQTMKEEIIPILNKPFQKIEEKGTLTNIFYEASITLITKLEKDISNQKTTSKYPS